MTRSSYKPLERRLDASSKKLTYLLHDQPIVLKRLALEANGLKFVELIPDYKEDIARIPSPFSQELCYRIGNRIAQSM